VIVLGSHRSEETKLKISQTLLGHGFSDETKQKISKTLTGRKLSDAMKLKLSLAHKGKIRTALHQQHLNEAMKGKVISPEQRKLNSEAQTKLWQDPEYRRRQVETHIGKATCEGHHASLDSRKKMSEAHKGHKASEQTKNKMSLARGGSKNASWLGGVSFIPYTPEFNRQLKELIRKRDDYKCHLCGIPEAETYRKLSVHHIDYQKENCLPNNLISLCAKCHVKTNTNRGYWQHYFKEEF